MAPKRKRRGPAKKGRGPVRKTSNPSTFRFLDLSVELRNRIYKLVLTLDGNGKCSTDLLLTCKQIDEEASSYLYSNTVKIRFDAASLRSFEEPHASLHIARKVIKFQQPRCSIEWPQFLRKAQSLSFTAINNVNSVYENEMVLYSLFSFLGPRHSLCTLKLEFFDDPFNEIAFSDEADIFSVRLLDKPQLKLIILGAGRPKVLFRDKITGARCNATSVSHACRAMYFYLQKFIPYTLEQVCQPLEWDDKNRFLKEFQSGSPGIFKTCETYSKMDEANLKHRTRLLLRFAEIVRDWYSQFMWHERNDRRGGYLKNLECYECDEDIPGEWWAMARKVMRYGIELEVQLRNQKDATAAPSTAKAV